jgi:hypothetical protein
MLALREEVESEYADRMEELREMYRQGSILWVHFSAEKFSDQFSPSNLETNFHPKNNKSKLIWVGNMKNRKAF